MAVERTIKLEADVKDALKGIDKLNKQVEDLGKSTKKTEKATGKLQKGFKGAGLAFKAMGIGLVLALFNKLSEAMMKNQVIADAVETVFNTIGIAFKMVSDTLISVYERVSANSESFDALGRVMSNLLNIAITPIKLSFYAMKLGIQGAQLAWKKSWLGGDGKDIERIRELESGIQETKLAIQETAQAAWESGKSIVKDFGEAVEEIGNIATIVQEEFKETFEDVTVKSLLEQGKAITETKKNYALLALEQARLIEQYDREAEIQRQLRDDVRLSIDERIAANEELGNVLEKQAEAETAAVQAQIDALTLLEELEGETNETIQQRFELETELLGIQAKVTGMQSEQRTNEAALQDERVANMQELTAIGRSQLEQRFLDLETDAENKRILAERTIEDETLLAETLLAIDEDLAVKRKEIDDELAATKKANLDKALNDTISVGMDILSSLSSLASTEEISQEEYDKSSAKIEEKALKRKKKMAILQILIDTAMGVAGAIRGAMAVPFPFNLIALASGVASVIAGIASAKAVLSEVPGDGGGGGEPSVDSGGGGEEADPSQIGGDLIPNMEAINQPSLGGGGENAAVQAYVVENDISSSQALQQDLELQSTL